MGKGIYHRTRKIILKLKKKKKRTFQPAIEALGTRVVLSVIIYSKIYRRYQNMRPPGPLLSSDASPGSFLSMNVVSILLVHFLEPVNRYHNFSEETLFSPAVFSLEV